METMADLNPLSPHHRPMMNDHLWSMVCCKAWLHCSLVSLTTLQSRYTTFRPTLQSQFLSAAKLYKNFTFFQLTEKDRSDQKLADIKTDLAKIWFLKINMSLIWLKLCFLQANFEEIYQKHVSRPSWQAFLAWGNQIFRANFKTRWTNRQQPRVEAKI